MSAPEVLVLHGSPGAGKTTLARALSELLREAEVVHGVIDLDELNIVYPWQPRSFAQSNLAAVWPNYAAVPHIKLILPTVVVDLEELKRLREAVPGSRFLVCELTAPAEELKGRVTAREPNEFWQQRLRDFVELFHSRTDLAEIRDFQVSTDSRSVEDAAREVLERAGWFMVASATDGSGTRPVVDEGGGRPVVHALVGLPAAGKSTVAGALAETGAVRFSLDEWMLRLHGLRYDSQEYADLLPACRNLIMDIAAQVLAGGGDVVLDWNHWSVEKRAASAAWAARCGADFLLHHVDVSLETAQRQLASRNEAGDQHSHVIEVEALRTVPSYYVAPTPEEGHDIRVHIRP